MYIGRRDRTNHRWSRRENVHHTEHMLINRNWEPEYPRAAKAFPDVKELSEKIVLKTTQIYDSDLEAWLKNAVGINARKLESTIRFYMRKDQNKALTLALRCARLNTDSELMRTAFQTLALFKDNSDIEQLFIGWLIRDNDPHSILRRIADNYWDE